MEGKFHHFFINTLVKNGGGWGGVGGLNKCVRDAKISKVELTGIIKMTSYIKQGVLLSSGGGGVEKKEKKLISVSSRLLVTQECSIPW